MLPKQARFSRDEFAQFRASGQIISPIGTLKYQQTPSLRVAIVLSSKHEKSAVKRNRLRRRFYVVLREINKQAPIHKALILYASKKSYTYSYDEIIRSVKEIVQKLLINETTSKNS